MGDRNRHKSPILIHMLVVLKFCISDLCTLSHHSNSSSPHNLNLTVYTSFAIHHLKDVVVNRFQSSHRQDICLLNCRLTKSSKVLRLNIFRCSVYIVRIFRRYRSGVCSMDWLTCCIPRLISHKRERRHCSMG